MSRTKRVFISDIHMGTAASVGGDRPYGWLMPDRARLLAQFLRALADDATLSELVIVGDLFDEWVVPYTLSPVAGASAEPFRHIAAAPQNAPIIAALQALTEIDGVTVTYVPGNHDMLVANAVLDTIIPGIRTQIAGPGRGVYAKQKVAAEHGSLYCLFNAPDAYNNPGHTLPLGFFVARSQAEGVTTGNPITKKKYAEVVIDALAHMLRRDSFSSAVFDAIVDAVHPATDTILMDGIDRYPATVTTSRVSAQFASLYREWDEKMADNVPAFVAALGEAAILYPAVLLRYALPHWEGRQPAHAVVMGHTHQWELRGLSALSTLELAGKWEEIGAAVEQGDVEQVLQAIDALADPGKEAQCDFIYANSGTWIDGDSGVAGEAHPPATFVAIDQQDDRTSVEVREYVGGVPASSPVLDSRYLAS